jgi:acetate kinase
VFSYLRLSAANLLWAFFMNIFVLNCGSSSLKFQLIETSAEQIAANQDRLLVHGEITKIGSADAIVSFQSKGGEKSKVTRPVLKHRDAIEASFDCLKQSGAELDSIEGVGHRIVHGGEQFQQSVIIDDAVVRGIEGLIELAPLHNPHNLKGYYASKLLLPQATHVAVFDTAFHQTMPPKAYLYGLPYLYYTRDKLRRYGFHGTSHRYVSYRFAQIHNSARDRFKLIQCHLGNGCSVCAVERGVSVDTSMGFTPLEGLIMGTRPGDLDPGAVLYLVEREEMGLHEVDVLLNKHSGLYGLSGVSNDMRDLLGESAKGNSRATLAIDAFCYRVTKYIGAYLAAMGGADTLIFTGGIGENAPAIRAQICSSLGALGIGIDLEKNNAAVGKELDITGDSKVQTWVIPTNEELLIARDTMRAILKIPNP